MSRTTVATSTISVSGVQVYLFFQFCSSDITMNILCWMILAWGCFTFIFSLIIFPPFLFLHLHFLILILCIAFCVFQNYKFTCLGPEKCMESNASSIQMQGDSDYFINHLGVPALQFSYQDSTTLEVIVNDVTRLRLVNRKTKSALHCRFLHIKKVAVKSC